MPLLNEQETAGQVLLYVAVYFMFEITCIFCHFRTIRFPFEALGILGFLRPYSVVLYIYCNFYGNEYFENLTKASSRYQKVFWETEVCKILKSSL